MKTWIRLSATASCMFLFTMAHAQQLSEMQQCLLDKMNTAEATQTTIADVRSQCEEQLRSAEDEEVVEVDAVEEPGVLTNRMKSEKVTQFDPYVLTPHRRNYMLPVLTTNNINRIQYADIEGYKQNLEEYESKFQLSFKVPLNKESLLFEDDQFFFGFTECHGVLFVFFLGLLLSGTLHHGLRLGELVVQELIHRFYQRLLLPLLLGSLLGGFVRHPTLFSVNLCLFSFFQG